MTLAHAGFMASGAASMGTVGVHPVMARSTATAAGTARRRAVLIGIEATV